MYFKIKWWQLIFYEIAVFSFGILIATHWYLVFVDYKYLFSLLFIICGVYTIFMLKKQVVFSSEENSDKDQNVKE